MRLTNSPNGLLDNKTTNKEKASRDRMNGLVGNAVACKISDGLALCRVKLDCTDEPELSALFDQAEAAWKTFFRAVRQRGVRLDRIKNKGRKTKKGDTMLREPNMVAGPTPTLILEKLKMPRTVNTTERETETLGLSLEQFAASAYRAGTYASQKEPLAWGLLSERDHFAWLEVGKAAPEILASLEGKSYSEAAMRLWRAFVKSDATFPDRAWALSWEAVARHLNQLMDDDEIDDLEALEQSWRGWATKRLLTEEKVA